MSFVRGLDVGWPQDILTLADWRTLVQQGIKFVYVRCAEGPKTSVDTRYAANVAGSQAVGLAVGPYLIPELGPGVDPVAQADAHWAACKGTGSQAGELPPMVDFEVPAPTHWPGLGVHPAQLVTDLGAYTARLAANCGRTPTVYSYPYYLQALTQGGADLTHLATYPLHLASYPHGEAWPPDSAPMPSHAPWGQATVWQCCDGGSLWGMKLPNGCRVDTDVMLAETLPLLTGRFVDTTGDVVGTKGAS